MFAVFSVYLDYMSNRFKGTEARYEEIVISANEVENEDSSDTFEVTRISKKAEEENELDLVLLYGCYVFLLQYQFILIASS